MWQTNYDLGPHANFTFSYSIRNFDISHITHINIHHPKYMGEHGLIKRINESFPLKIFLKHGGDDHDLY